MSTPGSWKQITRRLGFRLTAGYVGFCVFLLVATGVFFRSILLQVQDKQVKEQLEDDWVTIQWFLNPTSTGVEWVYDYTNPQDSFLVERLQRVYFMADEDGNLVQASPAYRVIGEEPLAVIRDAVRSKGPLWLTRHDFQGTRYIVRLGVYRHPSGKRFVVGLGRNMALTDALTNRFTWLYFSMLPAVVLVGWLFGWWLTRRGLHPLDDVVRAADSITGSNLSLRIPLRGAGDELDRLIDRLNRMIERLENSFQQMRQFTADVSHELRTPITGIRGQLEVALMTAKNEEQLREAIQVALEETERLSDFIKAMLQLSQAESGQLVLHKKPEDLCVIAADAIDRYAPAAEEAGLTMEADFPEQCIAEVDRVQIERLLDNLISNAIKYTPAGGRVRIAIWHNPHRVELTVADTGRGIPPEHQPHVFDRFYRVPSADATQIRGVGLGLSFVAWIAKAHGGRVDLKSAPGEGSEFRVTLPKKSISL